ncbi:carboxylesterase family [Trichoderma arundinaceum]|uniref:Carboxylesterase family n=1 Tax=Trichoderma arundinaceum TaxID=490622 RepID=A0A395NWM2_TRIAR|nr:carboxylesterase family [Trichoderma arundinaceum]
MTASPATEDACFDGLWEEGNFDVRYGGDIFQRSMMPASPREGYYEQPLRLTPKQITTSKRNLAGDSVGQDPCPGQRHGQGHQPSDVTAASELKKRLMATSPSALRRAARQTSQPFRRRPVVDSETFQPLDSVREASTLTINQHNYENTGPPFTRASPERCAEVYDLLKDTVTEGSIWEQVKKHSAGQFEWLMTHLPSQDSTIHDGSSEEYAAEHRGDDKVYVCSLVLQKKREPHSDSECPLNSYYLLATPLQYSANWTVEMEEPRIVGDDDSVTWMDNSRPGTPPMKVPEIVLAVENAVSPTFTAVSDRSFGDSSSRATSFSLPRIEDSLEELDRLEDQIEALNEFTHSRRLALLASQHLQQQQPSLSKAASQSPTEEAIRASKRSTVACVPATVRAKPTERVNAPPRRSTSLTVREQSHDEPTKGSLSRRSGLGVFMSKAGTTLATVAKASIRPSKTPTIPNFELPGKAVARRLKEVREAREAHHAAALKALEAPPKPRSNKALPKPTFELPGDTISRRKKEENEAKLRAQEEEQRKRREFKARPVRPNSTPSTLPRDTVASRARQAKIQEETAERQAASSLKVKRLSLGLVRDEPVTPTLGKAEKKRGRSSMIAVAEEINRAILTSVGNATRSKNPLSLESMMTRLRPRNKEIQAPDATSITERKSYEKGERPMTAKAARDEAAERSRMASREWAERRRRKETSMQQLTAS